MAAPVLVAVSAPMALATTDPSSDSTADPQAAYAELTAEVARINELVTAAEGELQRLTVEAEAAADASRASQDALAAAQTRAATAAAELGAARTAVEQARGNIVELSREAFMGSDALGTAAVLLDADGPDDMLDRAATLELLGDDRAQRLQAFQVLQARQEQADQAARASLAEQDAAARAATEADAAAQRNLTASQQSYAAMTEQKVALDAQLRDAEIRLLAAQGVDDPTETRDREARNEAARERAGTSGLVAGRVTSCYGSRWGTNHNGIDIAAPIGTPISAPEDGVVLHAGTASGFGYAVYIQHPDGTITVYGHINQYFVSAGQRVTAGQQIAEVGNRGQSTGPHLHIETHTGGLYQNRVNPAPWLAARGITLGGACG